MLAHVCSRAAGQYSGIISLANEIISLAGQYSEIISLANGIISLLFSGC
jgi:hypothetical protein